MIPAVASGLPLANCCIWVVEDVTALRLLAQRRLQGAGAEVVVAADLAQAQALRARAPTPDLVCLDLDLPDGDGLTLAPLFGAGKCFAFTASTDLRTRSRCLAAGLAGMIDKTLPDALVAELSRALRDGGLVAERALRLHRPAAEAADALQRRYLRFLAEQRLALVDEFLERELPADPDRVRSIAHRLSGTAVHFRLPEIGSVAQRLSTAVKRSDAQSARGAFEELEEVISDALESHHPAQFERLRARTGAADLRASG